MTLSLRPRATIVLLAGCGILSVGACSGSAPSPLVQPVASSSASSAAATPPASSPATTITTPSATAAAPSTSSSAAPSASPSAPAPAAADAITIRDFMFTLPASVLPGATVTITNADAQAHTVTSKAGGFDVKVDGHGGVATLTAPQTAGVYGLTCDFHANMTGSLTVK